MTSTFATIVYVIVAFGAAYILGHSAITLPARKRLYDFGFGQRLITDPNGDKYRVYPFRLFIELIECPACLGFWLGIFAGAWLFETWRAALVVGIFTCSCNFLIGRATGLIANPRGE